MLIDILLLVLALTAVVKAADLFLWSAEEVGSALKLPSFILGVVLVGFGTSLPELATSVAAATDGASQVTLANIAGSNIANILIIIGITAFMLGTIKFEKDLIDLDLPLLFGVTILFIVLVADGLLSRGEAGLLLAGFAGYMVYAVSYKENRKYHKGLVSLIAQLRHRRPGTVNRQISAPSLSVVLMLVVSLVMLAASSKVGIDAMLRLVTQLNIGVGILTFFTIAIGTSLPELLVSLKAVKNKQGDIVLGNIIGSCIFNILLIGGIGGMLGPQNLAADTLLWTLAGMGLSVALLVVSGITRRIHTWEGFIYLLTYVGLSTQLLAQ